MSHIKSPADHMEGNSPLIVKTTAVGKSNRLVNTRIMSVEASCATFGDVLEAIKKDERPRWSYILEADSYEQEDLNGDMVQIDAGDPRFPIPLPLLFTEHEWEKLKKLNNSTRPRNHSARLSATSDGKPYVIIPHSEFNEEMVSFIKNVGVKATLFSSPDDLEVKDEDFLFGINSSSIKPGFNK